MAVKKISDKTVKLDLSACSALSAIVPSFNVKTYADMEKIEALLKKLSSVNEIRSEAIKTFFKEKELEETTSIGPGDEHYPALMELLFGLETGISTKDTGVYSKEAFEAAIAGVELTFANRKLLQTSLIK